MAPIKSAHATWRQSGQVIHCCSHDSCLHAPQHTFHQMAGQSRGWTLHRSSLPTLGRGQESPIWQLVHVVQQQLCGGCQGLALLLQGHRLREWHHAGVWRACEGPLQNTGVDVLQCPQTLPATARGAPTVWWRECQENHGSKIDVAFAMKLLASSFEIFSGVKVPLMKFLELLTPMLVKSSQLLVVIERQCNCLVSILRIAPVVNQSLALSSPSSSQLAHLPRLLL
mmetsp:Transcript_100611/g.184786  ORF Transcript_100611/g.184786 Transcript_100611/m.184786 type:complete len:226 (+) Transcript_100611:351-1028(+)